MRMTRGSNQECRGIVDILITSEESSFRGHDDTKVVAPAAAILRRYVVAAYSISRGRVARE